MGVLYIQLVTGLLFDVHPDDGGDAEKKISEEASIEQDLPLDFRCIPTKTPKGAMLFGWF